MKLWYNSKENEFMILDRKGRTIYPEFRPGYRPSFILFGDWKIVGEF